MGHLITKMGVGIGAGVVLLCFGLGLYHIGKFFFNSFKKQKEQK